MASNASTAGLLSSSLGSSWRSEGLGSGSLDLDLENGSVEEDPSRRPEAGPLPRKRGEIGYAEEVRVQQDDDTASASSTEVARLPERHPEERSSPASPTGPPLPSAVPHSATPLTNETTSSPNANASDASSVHSSGKHSLISFLKPKHIWGISLSTLLRFAVHIICIAGTVVAWVVATGHIPKPSDDQLGLSTTEVFVHVVFVIVTLMQLIFLERIVFRLRAERYAHKHPGQTLPTSRNRHGIVTTHSANPSMGLAPWNRPPLPTYAAALAANGHGTGDVEDNIIAIPPPPAYGNTRGSTLLLAGLMPENLRAQRTRERVRSSTSETVRGSFASRISRFTTRTMRSSRPSRPVSYRSQDSDWEERMDANRAMVLEETLAKLEEGKALH
ncbi:hypothetical protein EIP91_001819 [Steccherinum ochraceum]|uniref:Uncharacterized protein n=1 Tax=Steccherinum ochraceum TaxID=92696 RepID=A0A4R0S0Z3_9APHY|nr:hypothetical protein EIP91_001819 [Steccherinum ochraceum]